MVVVLGRVSFRLCQFRRIFEEVGSAQQSARFGSSGKIRVLRSVVIDLWWPDRAGVSEKKFALEYKSKQVQERRSEKDKG